MADKKPGLWANIHAKRQRGEAPAKPGDKDYPDAKNWKKVTSISEKKGTAAWQKAEGKNPEGGLNEKGRASLKAQGHDIKRPQPEGGARKDSFCARMKGMKAKLTSSETANDPDSRINKSLRKWKCGSADVGNSNIFNGFNYGLEANNMSDASIVRRAFTKQAKQAEGEGLLARALAAGKGYMDSGKNYYKGLDPVSQAALIGSLTGAGVGGLGNLAFGNKRKGALSRLAAGAAAGGLGGAFFGPASHYSSEYIKSLFPNAPALKAKGGFVGPPVTVGPPAGLKGELGDAAGSAPYVDPKLLTSGL